MCAAVIFQECTPYLPLIRLRTEETQSILVQSNIFCAQFNPVQKIKLHTPETKVDGQGWQVGGPGQSTNIQHGEERKPSY